MYFHILVNVIVIQISFRHKQTDTHNRFNDQCPGIHYWPVIQVNLWRLLQQHLDNPNDNSDARSTVFTYTRHKHIQEYCKTL